MRVEMRTVGAVAPDGCAVVLLPGRWNAPKRFFEAGFAEAMQQRGLTATLLAPDAHLGYYRSESILDRLGQDVFERAEVVASRHVTVVGVSLGGLGALLWAREGHRPPDQLVLLAPYLGPPALADEVADAGGLEGWQRPEVFEARDFRRTWAWFQDWAAADRRPPIFLAWGRNDSLAATYRSLAPWLGPDATRILAGDHDWGPWRAGWDAFLATGALDHCRDGATSTGDSP